MPWGLGSVCIKAGVLNYILITYKLFGWYYSNCWWRLYGINVQFCYYGTCLLVCWPLLFAHFCSLTFFLIFYLLLFILFSLSLSLSHTHTHTHFYNRVAVLEWVIVAIPLSLPRLIIMVTFPCYPYNQHNLSFQLYDQPFLQSKPQTSIVFAIVHLQWLKLYF